MKLRDFNIRGLAGIVYSRGLNTLTDEANKIPGIAASTEDQGTVITWFSHVRNLAESCRLAHRSGRGIVMVGHSFGANAALMAAGLLNADGIAIDLLVAIDPARQDTCVVPHNVRDVINPYQQVLGQLGQGIVVPFPGYRERRTIKPAQHLPGQAPEPQPAEEIVTYSDGGQIRIERCRLDQPHITIDDDPRVHRLALDAMRTLVAT
jgi:pimeloyl-ACP methyl ester carboxylesterase